MANVPTRPRRGTAVETRARIVAAALRELDRAGYHGTDTNRIARAAGYSPATFYKHFADKRAVFLAVYRAWVDEEWSRLLAIAERGGTNFAAAAQIVDEVFATHARHAGMRASLRELVHSDPAVRRVYRAARRRQLRVLERAIGTPGGSSRELDAILLFVVERVADALADGEARALGLSADRLRGEVGGLVAHRLVARPAYRGR